MKISKLEEHSIRLMVALAKKGGRATITELAEIELITEALTAKILNKLQKGGLVRSLRGRSGGYETALSPDMITVAAVIRALGKPVFEGCVSLPGDNGFHCPHISDCSLRSVWNHVSVAIEDTLDQITISGLLNREQPMKKYLSNLKPIKTSFGGIKR